MSAQYLTTAQVATQIQMSEEYVARQCAAVNLKAPKLGTEWRIHPDNLRAFMGDGAVIPSDRAGRKGRESQSARQRRRSA